MREISLKIPIRSLHLCDLRSTHTLLVVLSNPLVHWLHPLYIGPLTASITFLLEKFRVMVGSLALDRESRGKIGMCSLEGGFLMDGRWPGSWVRRCSTLYPESLDCTKARTALRALTFTLAKP
jgi:hypothetical protein